MSLDRFKRVVELDSEALISGSLIDGSSIRELDSVTSIKNSFYRRRATSIP